MSDTMTREQVEQTLRFVAKEADPKKGDVFTTLHWLADRIRDGAMVMDTTILNFSPYVICRGCRARTNGLGEYVSLRHWPNRPVKNEVP